MASWITDLVEVFNKELKFWEMVHSYNHAIRFSWGWPVSRRKKLSPKKLEEIVAAEKKVVQNAGGKYYFIVPFARYFTHAEIPEDYRLSFWTGLPLHPDRFEPIELRPGLKLFCPFFDIGYIAVDSKQVQPLNLGNITVTTKDSKQYSFSCNVNYRILNYPKAYMAVRKYDSSLAIHTLSILAKHCRGKSSEELINSEMVSKIEKDVLDELRETATRDWGLEIHDIYITDNAASSFQRVFHEGSVPVIDKGVLTSAS